MQFDHGRVSLTTCCCISISAIILSFIGCTDRSVWGYAPDEIPVALTEQPEVVLRAITVDTVSEIARLESEWPMVVALLAEKYQRSDLIDPLLEVGFTATDGSLHRMYGELLCERRLNERRYGDAELVAKRLVDEYEADPLMLYYYAQSLYRQEKDAKVLEIVSRLDEAVDFPGQPVSQNGLGTAERREVEILRAVSTARLALDGWDRSMLRLFLDVPISQIHIRAFTFLSDVPGGSEYFSTVEYDLMRSLSLAAAGRYESAYEVLPNEVVDNEEFWTRTVIELIRLVTTQTRRYVDGFEKLKTIANTAGTTDIQSTARFYSGLIARKAGWLWTAADAFENALRIPMTPGVSERVRWYLIDTARMISLPQGIWIISKYGPDIREPEYYDDTFESILSDVTASRSWALFRSLYGHLEKFGSMYIRSMSAHIHASLYEYSYVTSRSDASILVDEYLAIGLNNDGLDTGSTYYRLVSGGELLPGSVIGTLTSDSAAEDNKETEGETLDISAKESGAITGQSPQSGVLKKLLTLGEYRLANVWIGHHNLGDDVASLWETGKGLAEAGFVTDAMRLVDRYRSRFADDSFASGIREMYTLSYPLAYGEAALSAAEAAEVPAALFYAVIREESYFQTEVESVAGAIGLSQLMPATAADMAGRIGMKSYDLTSAEDNATIGAYYLAYCIDLFNSEFLGLIAYNAGLGRVREWLGQYGDLPSPLFLEAIPYPETRTYVRKVVRAMAFYEWLYPDIEPADELPILLPRIDRTESKGNE